MPPTGGETGRSSLSVGSQLWLWNERHGLGEAFDSSTGFTLPNGTDRSSDAAWVEQSRWEQLDPTQLDSERRSQEPHSRYQSEMAHGFRPVVGWHNDPFLATDRRLGRRGDR
jgi:hypothetical protein